MNQERIGEFSILSKALIWSLFPIVTGVLVGVFTPIFALALSTTIAAGFFAIALTIQNKWHELLVREAWMDLFWVAMLNGVLFYGLFFTGLQYTSAGNASIIAMTEVFFTMVILGRVTKKEALNSATVIGGTLMVIGTLPIVFQGTFTPNPGDLLILLAAASAPFGNLYTKQARTRVGPTAILFVRSVIAGISLFALSYAIDGAFPTTIPLGLLALFFMNGLIMLGFTKILWIEGIHRLTISKAISLLATNPVFTLFFAYLILGDIPTIFQLSGLVPILIGVWFLTHASYGKNERT